jgi:hypothetical protein
MESRGHTNLVSIKIKFKTFLEITAKQKKRKLSKKNNNFESREMGT